MTTRVKICGITRGEDADVAVHEGATAVGFIFVPGSPRFIEPDEAKAIIRSLPPFVTPVGVVAKTTRAEVLALIERSGIRCLQVHDDVELRDLPVPRYRSYRVSPSFRLDDLDNGLGKTFMLDAYVDGKLGGTGKTFDWAIAIEAKRYGHVILSGGINPDNVDRAIREVGPYAIDVNSGVERSPGVKDHEKIHRLFEAIVRAENERKTHELPTPS